MFYRVNWYHDNNKSPDEGSIVNKKPVKVSVCELEEILDNYLGSNSNLNYALKIVGHPGIGKSAIVREAAERKNYLFIDTRLAFKENIDLGGYPVPDHDNKRMIYFRPRFIPPEEVPEGYEGILWFLDEANRAHPTVIQTLFQIITEHTCGEHALPEKTFIVLAGNLGEGDNTTITDFDDSALDGRLSVLQLKPVPKEWLTWAERSNIHPSVIKYITLFPDSLWDEKNINPNPRGWHQVSEAIITSYGIHEENELAASLRNNSRKSLKKIITSLVSELAGNDFIFQQISPRELTENDILSGKMDKIEAMKQGEIPAEDLLWALSGAIFYLKKKNTIKKGDLSHNDLLELANILQFIGYSRPDTRISFFIMLIKECGVFTKIPLALKILDDSEVSQELTDAFTSILEKQAD